MTWGNLAWEETLPSGTDIELQVAFSDDEEGPWNFVGPDGTSGTKFTTSTGQSVYGSPSSRYCRYKAYLTGDGTDTPTLGTVELGFSGNLDSQIRAFAFDDAGNMTEKITKSDSSLIEETRTYNDLNQITQNQIDDGTTVTTWTFTHDDNGNMTSKSDGTDTYTYVWNEDNQLESVELNSSPVVDYVYDSGSRMLQRAEGSTTTNFHWDGWDLVREEKDDGVDVEVTNYLVPHGEVLAFERDDEWFYLHNDGISSTQLVTDDSGAQVGRMVYGAWGETLSSSESVPGVLDVRFVGGLGVRNDAATGLIWMRHRWYDCQLGRFISRDPIGLIGDTNLYRYGANNPATYVDPRGLQTDPNSDEFVTSSLHMDNRDDTVEAGYFFLVGLGTVLTAATPDLEDVAILKMLTSGSLKIRKVNNRLSELYRKKPAQCDDLKVAKYLTDKGEDAIVTGLRAAKGIPDVRYLNKWWEVKTLRKGKNFERQVESAIENALDQSIDGYRRRNLIIDVRDAGKTTGQGLRQVVNLVRRKNSYKAFDNIMVIGTGGDIVIQPWKF